MFLSYKTRNNNISTARYAIFLTAIIFCVAACTPQFNWREVSFDSAPITALLPCKPDRGSRMVMLASTPRLMHMAGCEAGGATFTLTIVDVGDPSQVHQLTSLLRSSSKATHSQFAQHGSVIVQAAIFGQPQSGRDGPGALSAEAIETFFTGLKLPAAR